VQALLAGEGVVKPEGGPEWTRGDAAILLTIEFGMRPAPWQMEILGRLYTETERREGRTS
jgi:hypothetical protein